MQDNNRMENPINVEAFHDQLLSCAENFAKKTPGDPEVALILEAIDFDNKIPHDDDDDDEGYEGDDVYDLLDTMLDANDGVSYNCLAKFVLPPSSSQVLYELVRFTLTSPLPTKEVNGAELKELPFETFALPDVLESGFPRDTRSGIMKGNIGALFVDGYDQGDKVLDQGMEKEVALHRRLAGICVILMRETRKCVGLFLSDDDMCRETRRRELIITFP